VFEIEAVLESVREISRAELDGVPASMLGLRLRDLQDAMTMLRAEFLRTLGRFDAQLGGQDDGCLTTGAWLRAYCGMAQGEAGHSVALAARLAELPRLAAAMAAGELTEGQATLIGYLAKDLPEQIDAQAEAALVDLAKVSTLDEVRDFCDTMRQQYAPKATKKAAERGWVDRGVRLERQFNGMTRMTAGLAPEIAEAFAAYFESTATKQGETDERTPTQRRHDALGELVLGALDDGQVGEKVLPEVMGQRPHVVMTVDVAGLLDEHGHPLAELLRAGRISAELAQRLACDAIVSRGILNTPSEVLDLGRERRVVSPAQVRALRIRDKHCRVPGCTAHVRHWHHIVWWTHGGPTDLTNIAGICYYHHRQIHDGHWQLTGNANKPLTMRAPDGREWHEQPKPQLAA
jgi:hypothetical protein